MQLKETANPLLRSLQHLERSLQHLDAAPSSGGHAVATDSTSYEARRGASLEYAVPPGHPLHIASWVAAEHDRAAAATQVWPASPCASDPHGDPNPTMRRLLQQTVPAERSPAAAAAASLVPLRGLSDGFTPPHVAEDARAFTPSSSEPPVAAERATPCCWRSQPFSEPITPLPRHLERYAAQISHCIHGATHCSDEPSRDEHSELLGPRSGHADCEVAGSIAGPQPVSLFSDGLVRVLLRLRNEGSTPTAPSAENLAALVLRDDDGVAAAAEYAALAGEAYAQLLCNLIGNPSPAAVARTWSLLSRLLQEGVSPPAPIESVVEAAIRCLPLAADMPGAREPASGAPISGSGWAAPIFDDIRMHLLAALYSCLLTDSSLLGARHCQ